MNVVAIDISPPMLERAAPKAAAYTGSIELRQMDVCALDFADSTFDTVVTACTFCSVPKPILGLRELRRVLKPGGQILMLKHVRSAIGPLGILMGLMTPLVSRLDPDLNRDTVGNVQKAGFRLRRVENVYASCHSAMQRRCASSVPEAEKQDGCRRELDEHAFSRGVDAEQLDPGNARRGPGIDQAGLLQRGHPFAVRVR